jgi:hypothetical protein
VDTFWNFVSPDYKRTGGNASLQETWCQTGNRVRQREKRVEQEAGVEAPRRATAGEGLVASSRRDALVLSYDDA